MVLVKKSYQEDPFAVIFVVVAWPEVAYGIDFYKKCWKRYFFKKCPGAWSERFEVISGSPGAHLDQNFEISPLGHLPDPKIHLKKSKIHKNPENPGSAAWAKPLNNLEAQDWKKPKASDNNIGTLRWSRWKGWLERPVPVQ